MYGERVNQDVPLCGESIPDSEVPEFNNEVSSLYYVPLLKKWVISNEINWFKLHSKYIQNNWLVQWKMYFYWSTDKSRFSCYRSKITDFWRAILFGIFQYVLINFIYWGLNAPQNIYPQHNEGGEPFPCHPCLVATYDSWSEGPGFKSCMGCCCLSPICP